MRKVWKAQMTNPFLSNPDLPALVMMESLDVSAKKETHDEVRTAVFCFSGLARGFALVRLFFDATNGPIHVHMGVFEEDGDKLGNVLATPLQFVFAPLATFRGTPPPE